MKIASNVIEILTNSQEAQGALCDLFGVTPITIDRHLKANKSNGVLTTAAAIKTISKKTGIAPDKILVNDKTLNKLLSTQKE